MDNPHVWSIIFRVCIVASILLFIYLYKKP